ncbi:MAG TPA: YdeI/OmpD-associated family protein [Candidatus Kapabacteria bacterium]|nr:YdeI/OmpD-associated family protein [Candidatus Kapabacteria bacterium]
MTPTFFKSPAEFRKWLEKYHDKEQELYVGFHKTKTGKSSMRWAESVDEALCFGWIDAVRKSIDEHSYYIRFTRRKPTSIWSTINIKNVERLMKAGLMTPAGLKAYEARKERKSGIYSYENEAKTLPPAYEKKFKANRKAWAFFQSQAAWYQRTAIHLIVRAKQEKTQLSRLDSLIKASESEKRIKELSFNAKK